MTAADARPDPVRARAAADAVGDSMALDEAVTRCRACPRLVQWREDVAAHPRASFADEEYWGRPVPAFGPAGAAIMLVGLAPAAHGANRTGRMFTGDRSGDFLYAALHRVGLANQPTATHRGDGLSVSVRVTAAVHCAPPKNAPTGAERSTCGHWLRRELELAHETVSVIVCLGHLAWQSVVREGAAAWSLPTPSPRPRFTHGGAARLGHVTLLGSYHPSQQNTFTGRLTEPMLDEVLGTARDLAS